MMVVIDGPHHVGKTTLVEETLAGYPQPKSLKPENYVTDLLAWMERWRDSDDIAVFDHFPYFSYEAKMLANADERFLREYPATEYLLTAMREVERQLRSAIQKGKVLLIRADHETANQRERDAFEVVFDNWNPVLYDYSDPKKVAATKQAIREFISSSYTMKA